VNHDIRLIAIDLDGTTVQHDTEISPRVLAAIAAARNKDVRVVIATGRNSVGLKHFATRMGLSGPMLAQQGGLIYNTETDTVLRQLHLPNALACELATFEQSHPEWKIALYHDTRIYCTDHAFFERQSSLVGFAPIAVTDLCQTLAGGDPEKVLFMVDPDVTPHLLAFMTNHVGARANVVQSHARFVEVNPLGADKGTGLAWLAEHYGLDRTQIMAIGDQGNDATMIAWAGLGVAMGNAREDIKSLAGWVAPTVEDDGAAIAIEKFVLGATKCFVKSN
jgi:Cof subfamily protein (haloacid dehalogenase superfamily)